jgi:short-subunit dehydrogenase
MTRTWRTAWITGASTGIGRELALQLARKGVKVAVSARSAERLSELATAHDGILPVPVDVTDRRAVADAHNLVQERLGPLDLAVLNAGVWHPVAASRIDADAAAGSMAVNYQGIVNALEPIVPAMVARRAGQIALVASVAGYRGLPQAAAYAPSKAAVIALAETMRLELDRHGIMVQVVNPGFVATPMTAVNEFPMPFLLQADDAANRIVRGLERGRFEIAFPWQLVTILKLLRILPYRAFFPVARRALPRG